MRIITNYILLTILLLYTSCTTNPEPLRPGKDVCFFCKMPIADTRFGAEIVTSKGRINKYDDVNCMINWLNDAENNSVEVSRKLVSNFSNNSQLIDVEQAVFIVSDKIHSPMNSGIASFGNYDELKKTFPEVIEALTWNQLLALVNKK